MLEGPHPEAPTVDVQVRWERSYSLRGVGADGDLATVERELVVCLIVERRTLIHKRHYAHLDTSMCLGTHLPDRSRRCGLGGCRHRIDHWLQGRKNWHGYLQ